MRASTKTPSPKKGAPKTKRAPQRRAPMTSDGLTRAERMILERMERLDASDPRYQVLEAALAFKASWVMLAEHLSEVARSKTYKHWGYSTFGRYCADEVHVTPSTAKKLVKSYDWIEEEAPELIPRKEAGRIFPQRQVPDYGAISVLADARRELEAERVPKDAYLALKQAALEGERTATQLRRELKQAIPEELRDKPAIDKVRSLRKALTAAVKVIEHLREWDGNDALVVQAEELRDALAFHLPRERELEPQAA